MLVSSPVMESPPNPRGKWEKRWGARYRAGLHRWKIPNKILATFVYHDLLKYFKTTFNIFIKVKQLKIQIVGGLMRSWFPLWSTFPSPERILLTLSLSCRNILNSHNPFHLSSEETALPLRPPPSPTWATAIVPTLLSPRGIIVLLFLVSSTTNSTNRQGFIAYSLFSSCRSKTGNRGGLVFLHLSLAPMSQICWDRIPSSFFLPVPALTWKALPTTSCRVLCPPAHTHPSSVVSSAVLLTFQLGPTAV